MTGYKGYSMSNNAVRAYGEGLVTASKIGYGIPAALIDQYVHAEEWHHTSSRYNRTNFYNPEKVLATFGIAETEDYPFSEYRRDTAVAALTAHKASKNKAPAALTGQTVTWLEWGGTRNHPKATEIKAENCTVTVKGNTATVTLPNGRNFQKRLTTNGFSYV